jgi:hypothetical protein
MNEASRFIRFASNISITAGCAILITHRSTTQNLHLHVYDWQGSMPRTQTLVAALTSGSGPMVFFFLCKASIKSMRRLIFLPPRTPLLLYCYPLHETPTSLVDRPTTPQSLEGRCPFCFWLFTPSAPVRKRAFDIVHLILHNFKISECW